MDDSPSARTTIAVDPRHVGYVQIMYALHSFAVLLAIFQSGSIVTRFLFSLPSIIAVIMNYARRSELRGTWLETHFSWQLRTFWTAAIVWILFAPLVLTIILIPLVLVVRALLGLWVVYRIARGWLAVRDGRTVPDGWF